MQNKISTECLLYGLKTQYIFLVGKEKIIIKQEMTFMPLGYYKTEQMFKTIKGKGDISN